MTATQPRTELDPRYSSPGAEPTSWAEALRFLSTAKLYWMTTVRADGRPHVTPLIAVWVDDALHICTGAGEQKARNLAGNPHCLLTTGRNSLSQGLDLVVEGDAVGVRDTAALQRIADAYEAKYGKDWHFDVVDGAFRHDAGTALVFAIAPVVAYGYEKGEPGGQTRWRFGDD